MSFVEEEAKLASMPDGPKKTFKMKKLETKRILAGFLADVKEPVLVEAPTIAETPHDYHRLNTNLLKEMAREKKLQKAMKMTQELMIGSPLSSPSKKPKPSSSPTLMSKAEKLRRKALKAGQVKRSFDSSVVFDDNTASDSFLTSLSLKQSQIPTSSIANNQCELEMESRQLPLHFLCPLTKKCMEEPSTASDGHTYEHTAIKTWLQSCQQSPVTQEVLSGCTLFPNHLVQSQIIDWHRKQDGPQGLQKQLKSHLARIQWCSHANETVMRLQHLSAFIVEKDVVIPKAQLKRLRGSLQSDDEVWCQAVKDALDIVEARCHTCAVFYQHKLVTASERMSNASAALEKSYIQLEKLEDDLREGEEIIAMLRAEVEEAQRGCTELQMVQQKCTSEVDRITTALGPGYMNARETENEPIAICPPNTESEELAHQVERGATCPPNTESEELGQQVAEEEVYLQKVTDIKEENVDDSNLLRERNLQEFLHAKEARQAANDEADAVEEARADAKEVALALEELEQSPGTAKKMRKMIQLHSVLKDAQKRAEEVHRAAEKIAIEAEADFDEAANDPTVTKISPKTPIEEATDASETSGQDLRYQILESQSVEDAAVEIEEFERSPASKFGNSEKLIGMKLEMKKLQKDAKRAPSESVPLRSPPPAKGPPAPPKPLNDPEDTQRKARELAGLHRIHGQELRKIAGAPSTKPW